MKIITMSGETSAASRPTRGGTVTGGASKTHRRWRYKVVKFLLPAALLLVTNCAGDPRAVQRIEDVCEASGFFKLVNGVVVLAYPAARLPVQIVNYGIDQVCMNPAKFAHDLGTVEWLLRNMPYRQSAAAVW